MNCEFEVIGIIDARPAVPELIQYIGKADIYTIEFFLDNPKFNQVFSLLNNRVAEYYKSEQDFVTEINTYLKKEIKMEINPAIPKILYRTKENYKIAYPIGCLLNHETPVREERYKRSCVMTNQLFELAKKIENNEFNLKNESVKVKVIVGEPHRLFINYFLIKKGFATRTYSLAQELKTTDETSFVLSDILLAEQNSFAAN
jgi:hypothetical protein